ncbi:hypothetical protein PSTG_03122 [Puccinia striiformis f. sp. tritici PST-78]|uniref:Uncharacterized protein n=1 Tax=Puccinia striiformis f. sp. tritici PST-78 TaxID=1165861 RepID=A0A0L0VWB0_9BASI|nr:hypothetical protein PSTG_03122 [Puccinia striiformis f. sp. tritici PST-78]
MEKILSKQPVTIAARGNVFWHIFADDWTFWPGGQLGARSLAPWNSTVPPPIGGGTVQIWSSSGGDLKPVPPQHIKIDWRPTGRPALSSQGQRLGGACRTEKKDHIPLAGMHWSDQERVPHLWLRAGGADHRDLAWPGDWGGRSQYDCLSPGICGEASVARFGCNSCASRPGNLACRAECGDAGVAADPLQLQTDDLPRSWMGALNPTTYTRKRSYCTTRLQPIPNRLWTFPTDKTVRPLAQS